MKYQALKNLGILALGLAVFSACSDEEDMEIIATSSDITITDTNTEGTAEGDVGNTGADEDDLVANATFENTIQIQFSETSATIVNPVPEDVVITQDGAVVTINSSISKVAYEVSGATTDGMLKIYSDKNLNYRLVI